jgi:putative aldouronate transport system substrate-binding protein
MKYVKPKVFLPALLTLILVLGACGQPTPVAVVPDQEPAVPTPGTGGANGDETTAETGNGEVVTLTYFVGNLGDSIIQSFNDNLPYQAAMEVLGINIEFIHAAAGQGAEQIGVMIASRDLPDIVEITTGGYMYPRGWRALVDDGFALRLNEMAETHMPDFLAHLYSDPIAMRQTILDCGTIWSVPCLHFEMELPWRGMSIRYDWLQQLGLGLPESIPELEYALVRFQQDLGVQHPMPYMPTHGAIYTDGPIVSAFGIGPRWFIAGGEYRFGPMQDEFREYLELLNRWFQMGLIHPDSPALDGPTNEANTVTGVFGLSLGLFGGHGPLLRANTSGQELDPDFLMHPFPNLPLVRGDTVHFRNFDFLNKGANAIISATSDHPYEAARFLNFGYTQEGFYLFNFGVEGISWERGPEGVPVWTDRVIYSELGSWVNIREMYKRHLGPFLRDWRAFPRTPFDELCWEMWGRAYTTMAPALLIHTQEEQVRFTAIMNDVNTVLIESLWPFITGAEPLDNFDAFRQRLVDMGIEELTEIQNAAFARYQARALN